jgi:GxxExxY protein
VIGAAIEVHRTLGPGLLESAYADTLAHELRLRGIAFARDVTVPLIYKGLRVRSPYRADLVVERQVVVEVKGVAAIEPVHRAQLLTYLRLTGCDRGLLLNFNVAVLRDGIVRMIR